MGDVLDWIRGIEVQDVSQMLEMRLRVTGRICERMEMKHWYCVIIDTEDFIGVRNIKESGMMRKGVAWSELPFFLQSLSIDWKALLIKNRLILYQRWYAFESS